jgi:hypothetical protein
VSTHRHLPGVHSQPSTRCPLTAIYQVSTHRQQAYLPKTSRIRRCTGVHSPPSIRQSQPSSTHRWHSPPSCRSNLKVEYHERILSTERDRCQITLTNIPAVHAAWAGTHGRPVQEQAVHAAWVGTISSRL